MPRSYYLLVYTTLLLSLVGSFESKVLIQTTNGTKLEFYSTDIIYVGSDKPKLAVPISATLSVDRNDVANKFYAIRSRLSIDDIVLEVQNKGALGVLAISNEFYEPGLQKYRYTDQKCVKQIRIPIYEVSAIDGPQLLSLSEDGLANLTFVPSEEDVNPWDGVYYNAGYTTWVVFNLAFSSTNIALCIWKLKTFITFYGGFRTSIACYVLLIELIGNILRVIYVVNLACFNALPARVSDIFASLSYPFTFSSYLLFTLYWHEMMTTSSVIVHPFIVNMRIPFYVCCAALLILDLVRIITLYTAYWENMPLLNTAIGLVFIAALIVFYLITTTKLLMRLKRKQTTSGRSMQLKKITMKVCIGVGFLFIFLMLSILYLTPLPYFAHSFSICWHMIYTFLNGASMMNILSFELVATGSSRSRSKGSSKPTSSGGHSSSARVESANLSSSNNTN